MKDALLRNFSFVGENIADKEQLVKRNIDTIVNAANPTLMGSDQGVDGAIHKAIDEEQGQTGFFNKMICQELELEKDNDRADHLIRCQRGEAVLTSGVGLCKHVIHVVGAKYDGKRGRIKECSSSTVDILESCYYSIVEVIKENPDIKNIAIPIISSGEYDFPFSEAAEIAVASIYNAIVEWKLHDPEIFEMSGLRKMYFFVYDKDQEVLRKKVQDGNAILEKYRPIMKSEKRVVFQSSARAHFRYWKEVIEYDEKRGYFSGAKLVRELLMCIRVIFLPALALKDLFGGRNWEKRRQFVERFAIGKALLAPLFCWLVSCKMLDCCPVIKNIVVPFFIIYNMSDTVTYLLSLVIMADIQRPSANIIRSMILLFVNYMEVSFGMAYLYFLHYERIGQSILFREAVAFGLLGAEAEGKLMTAADYFFKFADAGIKFFFITLVFGYFANHMHQRKFRS